MLAVEGVHVVCPSTTTASTFPTPASTIAVMATTATAATPTMVAAAAGVGLLPMVTVAAEPDTRSLLVPVVPTLGGSNPAVNSNISTSVTGAVPTANCAILSSNNSNNTTTTATSNPATMDQAEDFVKPILKDGEILLEVECGQNKAAMYLSKLCQGSKGPCIHFQGSWLTPNEFQFVSGRETAKDWKRSIRHHGKSLKLLLAKGILAVHPTMCDCEGCRIGAVLTRKGEKRRIPNGERKRKSTGNAPENTGTGAFRAVGNLSAVKTQDGPPEPKRLALDKTAEGNQSPLKESSVLNLPVEGKDMCSVRVPESSMQDVSKVDSVRRLPCTLPLMSLASPPEQRDASTSLDLKDNASTPRQALHGAVSVSAPVSPSTEVKVLLSSPGGTAAAISALDKSLSRLALYHAASASLKGSKSVRPRMPDSPRSVSVPRSSKPTSQLPVCNAEQDASRDSVQSNKDSQGQSLSSSSSDEQSSDSRSSTPDRDARSEIPAKDEGEGEKDTAAVSDNRVMDKDSLSEVNSQTVISSHSVQTQQVKHCEPNNNISITSISVSVSTPVSLTAPSAPVLTSPVIASAAPAAAPASDSMPPHSTKTEVKDCDDNSTSKHTETATTSPCPSSSSACLLSPNHSEKEGHITIRHPSPERQPKELPLPVKHSPVKHSPVKHSPVKPIKEHSAERHHKDRKCDISSSTSSEYKDRHSTKDKEMAAISRHSYHTERDSDRHRRHDQERADRDRKSGNGTGHSGRTDDAASSSSHACPESMMSVNGGGGRAVEGMPPASVPVQAAVADPAAFSEYMRMLAASQNGFVPTSMGCITGMFPLRSPADSASLNSAAAMMHPMQAAACGMFSPPTAMLPKDPAVMYSTSAGAMPHVSYAYGAHPGMTPLHLLPQQYSTASSAASMLDYSRAFQYLPWAGGLPLMMPDAMNVAAVAAAAAAAGSTVKRSREEMEALEKQRLQFGVPPFAMGSITPMDYMAAYRGMAMPLSCGLESSMYEKNAELLRKRMYPTELNVGSVANAAAPSKGMVDSPYLASLPEYYRALYCCPCMENQPGDIRTWPVEEVVKLVSSLDGCSVYSEIFREQRVNGKILVLLTTEHLMKNLGMKLGPAMTLTSRVAKLLLDATRSSGCNMCQRLASMAPAVQSAVSYS